MKKHKKFRKEDLSKVPSKQRHKAKLVSTEVKYKHKEYLLKEEEEELDFVKGSRRKQ